MTRAQEKAGDMMWEAVGADAREDWTVWGAANDPKVLATIELLIKHRTELSGVTKQIAEDDLAAYVINEYDVSPNRCDDVFLAAKSIIWREMS